MLAQQLQLELSFESVAVENINNEIEIWHLRFKSLSQLKYEQCHYQSIYLNFATVKTERVLYRHLTKLNLMIQERQNPAPRHHQFKYFHS